MKIFTIFFISLFSFASYNLFAEQEDDKSKWDISGSVSGIITHFSFKNWLSDDNEYSYNIGLKSRINCDLNDSIYIFSSEWDGRFSYFDGNNVRMRKSDDKFEINAKIGAKILKFENRNSLQLIFTSDLHSQFFPDYDIFSDNNDYVSNFMAPGILINSLALEYEDKSLFTLSLSPIGVKSVFVFDNGVEKSYYGINDNKKADYNIGAVCRSALNYNIYDNLKFSLKSILFYNYSDLTKVDFSIFSELDYQIFKVLKCFVSLRAVNDANLNVRLYRDLDSDGDIDDFDGIGNRLQINAQIGLSVSLDF